MINYERLIVAFGVVAASITAGPLAYEYTAFIDSVWLAAAISVATYSLLERGVP